MENADFRFGNIVFNNLSFHVALDAIFKLSETQKGSYVVTPNVDHIVLAEYDSTIIEICHEAALAVADSMPIIWASWLLGPCLKQKDAGTDLTVEICRRAADTGHKIFLLGGLDGEAELAKANLTARFPGLKMETYFPPFGFEANVEETEKTINAINTMRPDLILFGVDAPKQEKWIRRNRHRINHGVFLGVGSSIAICAGTMKRAPVFMRRCGLEWVFRMCQEPRRLALRHLKDFVLR